MSDLRFVRELGAEFERLEQAAGAQSRSGTPSVAHREADRTGRDGGGACRATRDRGAGDRSPQPVAAWPTTRADQRRFPRARCLNGGNCRTPAPT